MNNKNQYNTDVPDNLYHLTDIAIHFIRNTVEALDIISKYEKESDRIDPINYKEDMERLEYIEKQSKENRNHALKIVDSIERDSYNEIIIAANLAGTITQMVYNFFDADNIGDETNQPENNASNQSVQDINNRNNTIKRTWTEILNGKKSIETFESEIKGYISKNFNQSDNTNDIPPIEEIKEAIRYWYIQTFKTSNDALTIMYV